MPLVSRFASVRSQSDVTRVAIFTDNDFNQPSGLTTTLTAALSHAPPDVRLRIYTSSILDVDCEDFLSVPSISVGVPWPVDGRAYWPRLKRFARALADDAIDVIHVSTTGPIGLAGTLLARWLGLPMTGSCHAMPAASLDQAHGTGRVAQWTDAYRRWCLRRVEVLLVPSRACAGQFEVGAHVPNSMRLWPVGVDSQVFSPERRSSRSRSSWHADDRRRPVVLCAGRLARNSGLELLPAIQRRLHAAQASHRLVIAGDGPLLAHLRDVCPDAEFLGVQSPTQMAMVMASADVLLFPSSTDATGTVVLEAQASGLPVVVPDRGGAAEQIIRGETGLVASAGHAAQFASHVAGLLQSTEARQRMSAHARAFAVGRPWTASLAPVIAAWKEAATNSPFVIAEPEYALEAASRAGKTSW